MPERKKLVGPVEAGRRLGVGRSSIQRWIDAGLLKAHKTIGGHRRVDESELARFARSRGMPHDQAGSPRVRGSIILVDDDADLLEVLAEKIQNRFPDLEINCTTKILEVGLLVARFDPDILFLDINLPEVSGTEICASVRKILGNSSLHVAAITGHSDDEAITREFMAAGGERVFSKPPEWKKLFDYIIKAVSSELEKTG